MALKYFAVMNMNQQVRRPRRTWLWILLLIPVATFFFLIFHAKSSPSPEKEALSALDARHEVIRLEDVLRGKFYPRSYNGSFVDG